MPADSVPPNPSQARPSFAALCCVYSDILWLPYSYAAIYDLVEAVYFLVSRYPWHGPAAEQDAVLQAIRGLPDPGKKIRIETGDWKDETTQRNTSLALAALDRFTHAMVVDTDEVYDSTQLPAVAALIASRPEIECWHMRMFTYWKSSYYRIDPLEPHDPPVIVRLGAGGFVETRNILCRRHELVPPELCMCHHLSYARPDELIRRKHIWHAGHSQSMHADWYERKWKAWDSDHSITELHPVNPPHFFRAVPQPRDLLPPAIRDIRGLPFPHGCDRPERSSG